MPTIKTPSTPTSPSVRAPRASPGSASSRRMVRLPNKQRLLQLGSPKATSSSAQRTPILVEFFLQQGLITVGLVGQARYQRVQFVETKLPLTAGPAAYYQAYGTLLLETLEWLADGVVNRSVLVMHDFGYAMPAACQQAIERALLEVAGCPALSFHSTWWTVPAAVPGLQDALVVGLTWTGAHCYAYAAGQVLPFTYQFCPATDRAPTAAAEWKVQQQDAWLKRGNKHDLVVALLQCLQACPRASRKHVVHNLWLVGLVVVEPQRYVKALARALQDRLRQSSDAPPNPADDEPSVDEGEEQQQTSLPLALHELRPLADHVSAIHVDSADVTWLGASRWAHQLHGANPDAPQFQWKFPKS